MKRKEFIRKLIANGSLAAAFPTLILQSCGKGSTEDLFNENGNVNNPPVKKESIKIDLSDAKYGALLSTNGFIILSSDNIIVINKGEEQFIALSSKCTHLGCTVPWVDKENKFACPCHGSSFDIKGSVISSPAVRPLDIYKVSIENNVVKVDTSKSIEREKFLRSQLVYAKKVMK